MSLDVAADSTIDLSEFYVEDMGIDIAATSDGTINVSRNLDLSVHAGSYLKYLGDPVIGEYIVSGGSLVDHQ